MKTTNKVLLGSLTALALGALLIMLKLGSIMNTETEDLVQIQRERFVIDRQMDQQALDSIKRLIRKDGGKLRLEEVAYNEQQALTTLKGAVEYDCCSQSFEIKNLDWMSIQKGKGVLKISYNSRNQASFGWQGSININ